MKFSLKQLLLSLTCASLGLAAISLIVNTRANDWEIHLPESGILLIRMLILFLAGPCFGAAIGILTGKLWESVLMSSIIWLYMMALFFAKLFPGAS